eukprot:g59334.t1
MEARPIEDLLCSFLLYATSPIFRFPVPNLQHKTVDKHVIDRAHILILLLQIDERDGFQVGDELVSVTASVTASKSVTSLMGVTNSQTATSSVSVPASESTMSSVHTMADDYETEMPSNGFFARRKWMATPYCKMCRRHKPKVEFTYAQTSLPLPPDPNGYNICRDCDKKLGPRPTSWPYSETDCFEDTSFCLKAQFCPCAAYGRINGLTTAIYEKRYTKVEEVPMGDEGFMMGCLHCSFWICFLGGTGPLYGGLERAKVIKALRLDVKELPGLAPSLWCCMMCCCCHAGPLTQEYMSLKSAFENQRRPAPAAPERQMMSEQKQAIMPGPMPTQAVAAQHAAPMMAPQPTLQGQPYQGPPLIGPLLLGQPLAMAPGMQAMPKVMQPGQPPMQAIPMQAMGGQPTMQAIPVAMSPGQQPLQALPAHSPGGFPGGAPQASYAGYSGYGGQHQAGQAQYMPQQQPGMGQAGHYIPQQQPGMQQGGQYMPQQQPGMQQAGQYLQQQQPGMGQAGVPEQGGQTQAGYGGQQQQQQRQYPAS